MTLLEIHSIEILWVININKEPPPGWGRQTLANTYNKLSIKKSFCHTLRFGVFTGFAKTLNSPKIVRKKTNFKDVLWVVEL